MTTQTLRPYQQEAVAAVLQAQSDGLNRVLYTIPTGGGKTTTFAELTKRWIEQGKRVLVVAHRSEEIRIHVQRRRFCGHRREEGGIRADLGH